MARKRRQQQRPARRSRTTLSSGSAMSHTSARASSDGTGSEIGPSDGDQTAMTSVADTEELSEGVEGGNGEPHLGQDSSREQDAQELEGDDDMDIDTASYAASRFPGLDSPAQSEIYLYPNDHRMTASDLAASTRSLWAQDLDYRDIHGRRYCREYFMPNDDIEQLRLALMHQVYLHVFDGDLTTIPLEDPTHILDIGTGTGEWAIRMAELFPECDVTGIDISAIAETRSVPMNVYFEIEDAEDWDRPPDCFDLIHVRNMDGAFRDWKFIYDNIFYSLKPGGWIELQDFDTSGGLDKFFAHFSEDSPIHALFSDLAIAAEKSGRPRGADHLEPNLLIEAGFVDTRTTEYVIPITMGENTVGKIWLVSCLDAMEAHCLRLLTEQMGWDPDRCKAACEEAARELAMLAKNPEKATGLALKVRVVVARKPFEQTTPESTQEADAGTDADADNAN